MRFHRLAWFGFVIALLGSQAGCSAWDRFRTNHPRLFGDPVNDPFVAPAGGFGAGAPSYPLVPAPGGPAVVPGAPGSPEVLTPQNSPPPVPTSPPNFSGYGIFPPPNGIAPAEATFPSMPPGSPDSNSLRFPSPNSGSTTEPPLAPKRRMSEPEKPQSGSEKPDVNNVPADLREPGEGTKTPRIPKTETDLSSGMPVGIPGFWQYNGKISLGLKPDTDGLDWLRDKNDRSVLHLRRKGSDDSSHKQLIEKRGLKYASMEISAATLTKDQAEEFSRHVNESANQPIFIYDEDGSLTGAMWYLYLRISEKMPAELAKTKAERVGLRVAGDAEQKALWAAIQTILPETKP